jgi:hypothetical protein
MPHKFEPADEKYWAEQRLKHQAAILRQKQEQAAKTNFTDLFTEESTSTNHTQQQ